MALAYRWRRSRPDIAESAQKDAVKPTFSTVSLKPKRLTGRYVFTVEQAAQVAGIEAALRRDLADAVMAKMSNQVINGDGSGVNVKGFLNRAYRAGRSGIRKRLRGLRGCRSSRR